MRLFALLSSVFLSTVASADAVTVSIQQRAELGKGVPHVEIHIHDRIAGFRLQLSRSDGQKVDVKGGGRPGLTRRVELQQPEGRFSYTGTLSVVYPDSQTAEMPLEFEAELWGPLKVTLDKKHVDIAGRKVAFQTNRAVDRVDVQVVMDSGEEAFRGEVPGNGMGGKTPVTISWPEAKGTVLKIAVSAHDAAGYYDGFEIFPYEVYVPHEELIFASGKWDIRDEEAPKLEKVFPDLKSQAERASRWAPVALYIMGHTDTVGSAASNRTLSFNRAKSIGTWFRKHGLHIPIYYEGFGEEAPAVGTPDETDEPRNRRADYILSVEPPSFRNAPFAPRWKKL